MENYKFTITIEKDKDGYFAFCPELQGCYAQGETYEEAMGNIRDVVRLHIKDRAEDKEIIPKFESISLTTLEFAV